MANGTPKPLALVQGHRTKAEKAIRAKAEAGLLTGTPLKENAQVKANPIAHAEFTRIKKLLKAIQKDDDLSGNIINSHCMLHAECKDFEDMKSALKNDMDALSDSYKLGEMDFMSYVEKKDKVITHIMACDKKIMEKRKMILDIAKENIMTIQSALRSVPKKEQPAQESAMTAFLKRKAGG